MFLSLRTEVTNLLFHYYNTIGSLQRDINNPEIQKNITFFTEELKKTKETIFRLIDLINEEMNEKIETEEPEMDFFSLVPGFYE